MFIANNRVFQKMTLTIQVGPAAPQQQKLAPAAVQQEHSGLTFGSALALPADYEPVDLIIAHTHPMLAPAWYASRAAGCRWGFDCEDLLSEEFGEGIDDPRHQALVRFVEQTFNLAVVPDPTTMLLVGAGIVGLGWVGRRRA